jgi:hypothetical protein
MERMIEDSLEARMAERLCAIDWTSHYDRTYSRLLLMREYLRRSALWAQEYGCTEGWPFFDLAACVDPSVRADPEAVGRLNDCLAEIPLWEVVKETCVWALHWAALTGSKGDQLPRLDDPFEPLVAMYERGGGFSLGGAGFIDIDAAGVRRKTWQDHAKADPVVAIDTTTLDARDVAGPQRTSG